MILELAILLITFACYIHNSFLTLVVICKIYIAYPFVAFQHPISLLI
jgi:hypothetical protein